jgi:hypothetical protein
MLSIFALLVVLSAPPAFHASDQAAIEAAVTRGHPGARVTSVFISGDFAVAQSETGGSEIREGLSRQGVTWRVTCELPAGTLSSVTLSHRCRFSRTAAAQLSADIAANAAASQGRFAEAAASAQTAFSVAQPTTQSAEAARVQLLHTLSQQLQLGQISRSDAIHKWNEMRFSFFFP